MNIAIFTNNYLPNPYGVAKSIESFREEFEKRGHTVYIFAPRTKGYADENPNVFRYPSIDLKYKISFPLGVPFSRRIDRILENLKIDVVHSQHPNLLGWTAKRWAKKKRVPLVFTWHTLYDRYVHFVPLVPKGLAAWWVIRQAARYANNADAVVAPSESLRKIISQWGVAGKNTAVIPTGIDEEKFLRGNGKNIKEKYGIKFGDVVLLTVCRLTEEKNVIFLFESVMKAMIKNERLKFIAVSGGNLEPRLRNMARLKNIEKRIFFTGVVENVEDYYAAADVFVYASKSETQGMIISEAMYMKLPVVAVRAPGIEDAVVDGETGFLIEENEDIFSEKIERLAMDKELRDGFSKEARKIASEKYTSKICADKMLKLYEKTVSRKNPA